MTTQDIAGEVGGGNKAGSTSLRLVCHRGQVRLAVLILLLSLASYLFISRYLMMAVEVKGASMMPTLLDGQRYVLYRWPFLWRGPREGEIVVIQDPEDHGLSVKRIVGVPDETVEIRRDGFYRNGVRATEPYLISRYKLFACNRPTKPLHLGSDSYFVLGDNRDRSADSRVYGPVRASEILGVISR